MIMTESEKQRKDNNTALYKDVREAKEEILAQIEELKEILANIKIWAREQGSK